MLEAGKLIGYACLARDTALVAWAVSFATDYQDRTVTNVDLYRAGLLAQAKVEEQLRCDVVAMIPGRFVEQRSVNDMAMQMLIAMMGPRGSDYTQGIKRPFPKDAVKQALRTFEV